MPDFELSFDPAQRRAQRAMWRQKASSLEDRQARAVEDLVDVLDEILFVMQRIRSQMRADVQR